MIFCKSLAFIFLYTYTLAKKSCTLCSGPSPSPSSWPSWAYQCPWPSSIFSQRQKTCCLTFWYNFLMVKKVWNSTILFITCLTKMARSSLSMFMAKSFMISKPESMLFNLLVWFYDFLKILQPFPRLRSLILVRFDLLWRKDERLYGWTSGHTGLLSQPINCWLFYEKKVYVQCTFY